jgi:2-polyprenyl-3-methyl-5-hydroxy-6-metoxy-1,4-benzoquinol methylase
VTDARDRCSACGSERFGAPILAFDRQHARREDYRYARCSACSLLSMRPVPRDDEIAGLYPREYGPHELPRARQLGLLGRFAARRRFSVSAQDPLSLPARALHGLAGLLERDLLEPRGEHRLLDVGCGAGGLLARYRELGWQVRGIDLSEGAVEACRAQGLTVQQAGLLEADLPSRSFDAILLHHVIEHVPRPLDALRRARELLAPGGTMVVVTPNAGGLGFRMYGSCWYALDAPRHLHLFDAATLTQACESAGLAVRRLRSVSSSRVLAWSRHYARSQGPVLPPGLAARAAALERSREEIPGPAYRRLIRPVATLAAWLGWGETLRATLFDPGRRA